MGRVTAAAPSSAADGKTIGEQQQQQQLGPFAHLNAVLALLLVLPQTAMVLPLCAVPASGVSRGCLNWPGQLTQGTLCMCLPGHREHCTKKGSCCAVCCAMRVQAELLRRCLS
jgi:hypothetical protein